MNIAITSFLNSFAHVSVVIDVLVIFSARILPWLFLLFFFLETLLIHIRNVKPFLYAFVVFLLSIKITALIKFFVALPRPFEFLEIINPLFIYKDLGSFPSGHALVFFALAMYSRHIHSKFSTWYFLSAVLISLSRVIAGVHFAYDVIFGAFLGTFLSYAIVHILKHGTLEDV